MRCTVLIGSQADDMQHQSIKPKYDPCPQCGTKGKRQPVIPRRLAHVAALHRRSWIGADVGVSKARGTCCKSFQAPRAGVPYRGRYSLAVRHTVAHALMRDRMPSLSVIRRMPEDDLLTVSLGSIHACCLWAHEPRNLETHWDLVRPNFSGVLCLDEVHDSGRTMLFATAPLGDFTVSCNVVDKNDQAHMDMFLQALKDRGLTVEVVITEGSPLYQDSRQSSWADVEHPLCIFHVIKEVHKLSLDGVRAIKHRRKRLGNKGRKKRRGRPSQKAQQQRPRSTGMSKKAQATLVGDQQYLSVRQQEDLREQDKQAGALMWTMAPDLKLCRPFNQQFYRLFDRCLCQRGDKSARHGLTRAARVWSTMRRIKPTPFWPKRSRS